MTKFTVTAANNKSAKFEGDYEVNEAGVLFVRPTNGKPVLYGHMGWLYLEVTDS